MSLPVLLGLLLPLYSIFFSGLDSLRLLPVMPRAGAFGFRPQASASPFLGRFFQLLVQLRALCVIGVVLAFVGSEKNGIFVRAQQQDAPPSLKNETLSVTDLKIAYDPPNTFATFNALGQVFMRASEESGSTRVMRNARLNVFQGSALYYNSPLFPFDARVHFQLVLTANNTTSSSSSNDSTTPLVDTVIFDQTLFLLDNSTERITDGVDSIGPTSTQTFVIAENLDDTRNYTAIVRSDLSDETEWTWVGQFVITSPETTQASSGKPNLKVILPVSIIGSLIVIAIFILIALFLRRRTKNRKQAQILATYPPTPRAGSSDEKFEFSLVRPRGERSSILPGGTKSRSAGAKKTGGASATKASSKGKGLGSTRGIIIPSGGPRQVENVNEYGLQFEPLDLTGGENNDGSSKRKGKSATSSREGGGSGKSPISPSNILNVVSDEDELLEAQQALAYRSESRNAFTPLPAESTKSFSPNRPSHSHSNSQSHATVLSHPYSNPQSSSSASRHPTISMVSHNEHNLHSRHNSRKWDSQSVKTANTAEMLVKDIPYLQYLHRIADEDGTLISVKSANSQSMEGSGSGEHGAAGASRGGLRAGGGGVSREGGVGTTSDHDSPTSNLNPFGIPSPLPSHQQGRHPYAMAGGTIAHRASGASGSSGSHRSSGLMYAPQLAGMVTGTGGDSSSQAAPAPAIPVVQSHSRLANAEPAPRGVAEFGSKASLGLKPVRRRRTNSGADSEDDRQVQKEGGIGGGAQGVSSMLGSLRLLGAHLQPSRRRRKESEEDLEAAPAAQEQQQRQPGHATPKKSSSSSSLKLSQISAPMPIKPTRPALVGSSSPPSSYSAPNPAASTGAYPPPAPTPTPPLGASWTKRKAVPRFDELEGAGAGASGGGSGGSGSGSTRLSGSSTSLVAGVPQPPPLPLPPQEKPKDRERQRERERERERRNSAPPPVPPRSPSRQSHQHRQAPLNPEPEPAPEPEPEPRSHSKLEAPPSGAGIRPLPPRPLPHTPAPTPPASQTSHHPHHSRNVPSVLGGSSIGDGSTIVAPSTPSTAVGHYQPFHNPPPEPEPEPEPEPLSRDSSNDLDDMYGEEPDPEVLLGTTGGGVAAPVPVEVYHRPSESHSQSYSQAQPQTYSQTQVTHPSGGRPMPNVPVAPLRTQRPGTAPSSSASASMFTPPPPLPPPPGTGVGVASRGGKGYYDPVWYPDVVQGQLGASSAPGGGSSGGGGASSGNRGGGGRGAVGGGRPRTKRPVI